MDGYRQTILGRALADALRELEEEAAAADEEKSNTDVNIDGDHVFALFDQVMQEELREENNCHITQDPRFTHETLGITGQIIAFNRFMDDWSIQARVKLDDMKLNGRVADVHLSDQGLGHEQKEVAIRLKLRQRK